MQDANQNRENRKKIAVVLDARKLAMQYQQCQQELEMEQKRSLEQKEILSRLQREKEDLSRLAEYGRCEWERMRKEIASRLQAIVHFTGERNRIQTMQRMLSRPDLSPEEISELHRKISEEFRALYSTRPFSHPLSDGDFQPSPTPNWSSYRLRPSTP